LFNAVIDTDRDSDKTQNYKSTRMTFSRSRFWLCLLALIFTASLVSAATVATLPATGFGVGSATLNAVANPAGTSYSGHFEYGSTTNYGTQTGDEPLGNGNGIVDFSQPVTGLTVGRIYHFRADITTLGITLHGNDQAFFMPGAPLSTTAAATSIHPGQATLNATINPNDEPTAYWFQYGTNTSYGSITPVGTLPAGTSLVATGDLVTALPRGVTNHFCVVASNIFGQSAGADMSFAVPQGSTSPSGSTGGGVALDIRQPCLELNFLICTNGYYPSAGSIQIPFLGQICLFAGNFAPAGWVMCQGQPFQNISLYNVIGTTYGGDGVSYYLPDFRGCRAVQTAKGTEFVGLSSGVAQEVLTASQLPLHTHSIPLPDYITGTAGSSSAYIYNTQLSLTVNYLIAVSGLYPTQGGATTFEPFVGEVMLDASTVNVPGVPPNGQPLPINQNAALYSLLGTNYGGDGTATFNLPNLPSLLVVGTGQGPMTSWSLGQLTGAISTVMTTAQMPAHQHTVAATGSVTGFTGGNQPVNLIQPSMALQYLISTNGQIPSTTVQATNTMLGQVQLYAGTNLPGGWLPCDGRLLQIANARSLFGVISNWYGGDGLTTFALPNLCGRVPVGTTNGQPGATYGAEQTVLTVANLPPHTHTVPSLDFDRWITLFGLSGNAAGFTADADADQAENGYEWATGSNPTNAQSFDPLTINSSSNNVLIGFPRNTNATDVVFTLLRSTELTQPVVWTAIATNTAGVWTPSSIVTESGSTSPVNVTISDALTNAPAANYRLQITWP
jgi:microcystin-dependent protein